MISESIDSDEEAEGVKVAVPAIGEISGVFNFGFWLGDREGAGVAGFEIKKEIWENPDKLFWLSALRAMLESPVFMIPLPSFLAENVIVPKLAAPAIPPA